MLNDELHITLKQHTPLVVSAEDRRLGYFLRATELKPKLNRFLQMKYRQLHPGREVPVQWLLGKGRAEHQSLDFAVVGCYYWPMEEEQIEKPRRKKMINADVFYLTATTLHEQALHFRIQSDHPEILDCFQKHLPEFFAVENFGKRQSKGFGQFTVQTINETSYQDSPEQLREWIMNYTKSKVVYQRLEDGLSPDQIEMQTYRPLKAGINHTSYQKSYLWIYFRKKYGHEFPSWEKRAVKTAIKDLHPDLFENAVLKNPRNGRHRILDNELFPKARAENPGWYIRVLLGLAENMEFEMWKKGFTDYSGRFREGNYERLKGAQFGIPEPVNGYDKIKISIKPESDKVEQFASPLKLKVFDGAAFMVPTPIPDAIKQTKYEFEAKLTYTNKKREATFLPLSDAESKSLLLMAPPVDFSLVDFLDFNLSDNHSTKPIYERLRWERFPLNQ